MSEAALDELGTRRRARREAGAEAAERRAVEDQRLAFAARDFVMCGLPFKQPKGEVHYRRQNGDMTLEIHASPSHGLPYGQDRLLTIWLATAFYAAGKPADGRIRFRCASDILRAFGLCTKGENLARLRDRIHRVFYSTFFVSLTAYDADTGTTYTRKAAYRLMQEVRLSITDENRRANPNQYTLWRDHIRLDPDFVARLREGGRVPCDLDTVRALKESAPVLDLYLWQAWRSYRLARDMKGPTSVPVFGEDGLMAQIGSTASSPKKIKAMLRAWQAEVRRVWQACPNFLDRDCDRLIIAPAFALATSQTVPELPGVSPHPPPARLTEPGDGGRQAQLVLLRDDEPGADAAPGA